VANKVTFGFIYDFRNPPQWHKPWSERYAEILDVIAWTEQAGFEGAWIPEHHIANDGYMPSPLVVLAAIAARTKRMKIGSGIALAPLYNPVRFATDCAVLDILAGGRLEMGLAIGYRKRETEAFGVDFTKRGRMFDEWLEIVTRLWAGETLDWDSEFYRFKGAKVMPPPPRGRIPLFIGGFARKAVERVIRYGEGYMGTEDVCLACVDKLREMGRDPATAKVRITGVTTVVADDPDAAMDELAPYYLHVNNSYGEWFAEDKVHDEGHAMKPMSLDEFKASGTLQILKPDAAIAMFEELREKMQLDHYMMSMPPGLSAERFVHYAGIFASKVLPAFR
jgi:alkanesulfonate monooxygenase SsuD/methylene tetrahydromethanopterin reductase-like flavin-dependent oxidoreductase (luciferase family)